MSEEPVPSWVPQIAPGIRADVYPVSPPSSSRSSYSSPPAELRLDRHAVVHGYAERRLPFEFFCLTSADRPYSSNSSSTVAPTHLANSDLLKLRDGLSILRRSPPTVPQRVETTNPIPSRPSSRHGHTSVRAFPLQKMLSPASIDEWFSKLSSPASSMSLLRRVVPLGPAIIRGPGTLIDTLVSHEVPTQRAVWYIRVAVLNECLKHRRPDRPPLSPRELWTPQLSSMLRNDVESLRLRKSTTIGSLDRETFWHYLLDLARWQADEGLLDFAQWLRTVAAVLKSELANAQSFTAPGTSVAVDTALRFLPEFLADIDLARVLCDALLPGASAIVKSKRSSSQSQLISSGKGSLRRPAKRSFEPNDCHAEMTYLLLSSLQVLDPSLIHTGPVLWSDMERFVKRGFEMTASVRDVRRSPKQVFTADDSSGVGSARPAAIHHTMRECEMLPAHGDVGRVVAIVEETVKMRSGTLSESVRTICEWALAGPVSDRAEALSIACALLSNLAWSLTSTGSEFDTDKTPLAKRGKKLGHTRSSIPANSVPRSVGSSGPGISSVAASFNPPLQRELWQFLKTFSLSRDVDSLEKDDYIIRFIAQLCRLNLLSLQTFVRDVSRLSSCNHHGCTFLVKCLSLLPDPTDRSIADCRRSLLRKFGYHGTGRGGSEGIQVDVLEAACSGNMALMETRAETLIATGSTNTILSTSEAVRLENIAFFSNDPKIMCKKMYSMVSFLLYVDEPSLAVEWLLENLGDVIEGSGEWKSENALPKRREVLSILARLAGDLSRYIAGCGHLESLFTLLLNGFASSWVTYASQTQILHTLSSLTCIFGRVSANDSAYWTKMVANILKQDFETSTSAKMMPFILASMRGQESLSPDIKSMADMLNVEDSSNWGLSADKDLQLMMSRPHLQGVDAGRLREEFSNATADFPLEDLFVKGLTANDIIGCVFIPVLSDLLSESSVETSLESPFSKLAGNVLLMIESRQNDVRMQGVRPTLVIDFMALIITGCVCVHMDPSESLEVLVRMRWIWKILAPRAGILLAKRLRSRVDYYCDKTATTDKGELSALLSNMVTRLYGETGRHEGVVSSSIGMEPFGMVEMQLALLAVYRRECGQDMAFGSNIAEAGFVNEECAQSLTVIALQCCAFDDNYQQAVAGIMAHSAVQSMVESLGYVVTGLTMESSKNTAIHQERAKLWYEADRARRKALEHCVDKVSDELGSQVEAILFKQLGTAAGQLAKAMVSGSVPSDLVTAGEHVSEALESRLRSILRSKRRKESFDVWRQRSVEVARVLRMSVPLMKRKTVQVCLNVLDLCIRQVEVASVERVRSTEKEERKGVGMGHIGGMSGANADGEGIVGGRLGDEAALSQRNRQIIEELRREVVSWLTPALLWAELPEREAMSMVVGRGRDKSVEAVDDDGRAVDNWKLLEGFGRGSNEVCAVPPNSFWRQNENKFAQRHHGRSVLLKRSYATFSSLVA